MPLEFDDSEETSPASALIEAAASLRDLYAVDNKRRGVPLFLLPDPQR